MRFMAALTTHSPAWPAFAGHDGVAAMIPIG
jgi:hypothetical protein